MFLRAVTLLVWALAAGSAVFWGLKVFASPRPVPPGAGAPPAVHAGVGPLARVLGTVAEPEPEADDEAAMPTDSRFALMGVVASGSGRGGVALISVNGEPARPIRVGATVEGETVLLAVAKRRAELGPRGGETRVALELPEPAEAARGTLPPPGSAAAPPRPGPGGQPPVPGLPPMQAQILPPRQPGQQPMIQQEGSADAEQMIEDEEEE